MAMTVTTWTEEMVAHAVERIRAVGLRAACDELGKTEASLRSMLRDRRIDWKTPPVPPAAPAPPSGGVDVPEPEPVVLDWSGARPNVSGEGETERRIILSDPHIPYHLMRVLMGALAVIRALQPHWIINLGDFLNNGAVSHHPAPFGGREQHSRAVLQGASFLQAQRKAAQRSKIVLLPGNHDDWALEFEDANPQFRGSFAGEHFFGLRNLGIDYVPRDRQPFVLGPVAYKHGTGGGEHFCKRYAERDAPAAGVKCVVVGHHHTFQHYRARNGCEAWGAGWMGDRTARTFDYARKGGEPLHWDTGILLQDVRGDRVTTTPIRIDPATGEALVLGRVVAA